MSDALHTAIGKIPEKKWEVYGEEHRQEIRECVEVDFVPGEKSEHKDSKPLRYVAIRIWQRQEELFADGSKVKHFAMVSKVWESGAADRVSSGIGKRREPLQACTM